MLIDINFIVMVSLLTITTIIILLFTKGGFYITFSPKKTLYKKEESKLEKFIKLI